MPWMVLLSSAFAYGFAGNLDNRWLSDRALGGREFLDHPPRSRGGVRVGMAIRLRGMLRGDGRRAVLGDVYGETIYCGVDYLLFCDDNIECDLPVLHRESSWGLVDELCSLDVFVGSCATDDHLRAGRVRLPRMPVQI